MTEAKLNAESMQMLKKRLQELIQHGVKATEEFSGELNMSGCASSSCMAWA